MARPKTEYHNDVESLQKQARMIKQGREILEGRWHEVVSAMIDCAVKKKSPTAAAWLRDTFIGKPQEVQKIEVDSGEEGFTFNIVSTGVKND